ncbi:hypothetical protein JIN85_16525 [Luteolibacter pohnpeiensis]|uniref:Uncharacterized protein n=2 Tax=Luteolibacter pohnpeiensis TaxID=454153 RepID=A0A934SAQ1_9BACT|nr:hypothetical protein [Luteolibacter pohnpeiensis]
MAVPMAQSKDAGKALTLKSVLGAGFGEIIEIEGKMIDDSDTRTRAHLGKKLMSVTTIGDKELENPVMIELQAFSFSKFKFPEHGATMRIRGYETGTFVGIPQRAFEDIPQVATTDYHFESHFQVIALLAKNNPEQTDAAEHEIAPN